MHTHTCTHTHREINDPSYFFMAVPVHRQWIKKRVEQKDVLLPQTANKCRQRRFMGFGLAFYPLHRLPLRGGCFFLLLFSYCDDDQGGGEKETQGHDMHACLSSLPLSSLLLLVPSASRR